RSLADGAGARLRLLRERAPCLVELILDAQALGRRERAGRELLLELGDGRLQGEDLTLEDVRLALEVLDAHTLCGDGAELAELQPRGLAVGPGPARDGRRGAAPARRVHVARRDVAAVAARDLHRARRRLGEALVRDTHAEPRLVLVQPRR